MQDTGPFKTGLIYILTLLSLTAVSLIYGCGSEEQVSGPDVPTTITVWFHTGRPEEKQVIESQVGRFNAAQKEVLVKLILIPEGDYNTQVQAAAADGKLPDLLDLDGPYLYNYAWKNHILALDDLLSPEILSNLLPSIITQGTYDNHLYSVGVFDSGLGLYGSRSKLAAVGARFPASPADAWSAEEFERILADLSELDPDGMILDLRLDYRGEWYTYAFSPIIQSAGGDLIDRGNYLSAAGVLNGPPAVSALTRLQSWLQHGYVDPNIDTNSFIGGRAALSWCGHWEYPRYKKMLGDDLVIMPLPDFGNGSKTGMGSWNWAVTRYCRHPEAAVRFLEFLLKPEEVLAMSNANGAVPATFTAIAASPLYRAGGPLHLFVEQLRNSAVPRPQTPAYPVITSAFQQAFMDIRNNADVKKALDRAVAVIDEDIRDNEGYRRINVIR